MTLRTTIGTAFGVLVVAALAAVPVQAKADSRFYERLAVADADGDFDANGALDLVAVHVAERYAYDQANRTGADIVEFRLQLRDRDEIKQLPPDRTEGTVVYLTPVEYTLGFTAAGKDHRLSAVLVQPCLVTVSLSAGLRLDCNNPPPQTAAPHYSTASGGFTFVLDRQQAGLPVGASVSKVWAATAAIAHGQGTYQDVMPKDNADAPEGATLTVPPTTGEALTLQGTYGFLLSAPLTPLSRHVVPGGVAAYAFQLRTDERAQGIDHVFVDVTGPPGWTFDGNLGMDFYTDGTSRPIEYELRARAPGYAQAGDQAGLLLTFTLDAAGGHLEVPLTALVSEKRFESPEFSFAFLGAGPLKAERPATLQWTILHDRAPLIGYDVAADFLLNGRLDATVDAVETGPGLYTVSYTFPSGGAWRADLYIKELSPSPHAQTDLNVESAKSGALPTLGIPGVLAVLAFAAWRRL